VGIRATIGLAVAGLAGLACQGAKVSGHAHASHAAIDVVTTQGDELRQSQASARAT
jgi:hypothetical protein